MKTFQAPAKINVHLAVGGKRNDGYHSIESLFCRTTLADVLSVAFSSESASSITVHGLEGICREGEDTITKAIRLWSSVASFPVSATVECVKRIPYGAGLGGGSSDAATILSALQEYHPIAEDALWEVASAVGSDVPFFLSGVRCGWVTGRGAHVEECLGFPHCFVCIVMPTGIVRNTAEAYHDLDGLQRKKPPEKRVVLSAFGNGCRSFASIMRNDFRLVVPDESFYEGVEGLAEGLDGYGTLTGSGAAWCFMSEKQSVVSLFQGRICEKLSGKQQNWLSEI